MSLTVLNNVLPCHCRMKLSKRSITLSPRSEKPLLSKKGSAQRSFVRLFGIAFQMVTVRISPSTDYSGVRLKIPRWDFGQKLFYAYER